jgi:dTDP-4-amino-4,6-dideoxygalactose transaminase
MMLEALDSGWVAPAGPSLARFEEAVAAAVDVPHAVALSSGTAALHLALIELGVGPGDDVVVPTFTFAATANPVTYVRARPVFIDSDPSTWCLSADLLAEELDARAKHGRLPKAVIAVDLYGQCANYDRILPLCERYEIPVIEDAAEALGATFHGRPASSLGQLGILSFNGNKIITTSGGGMLVTRNRAIAEHARYLATQARDPAPYYQHSEIGFNYRLSNLLAALGCSQLADLSRRVARRRRINQLYCEGLGDLPVGFLREVPYGTSTHWLTCITVDPTEAGISASELRDKLSSDGIEARHTWKPMHLQPVFAEAPNRVDGTSEFLFSIGLSLPSGSSLSDAQQDRVIEAVRAHVLGNSPA